jgi:hypothetical protein
MEKERKASHKNSEHEMAQPNKENDLNESNRVLRSSNRGISGRKEKNEAILKTKDSVSLKTRL